MLAIEVIGGVYCPLSPQDPEDRLHALIKQTQSRLVLVQQLTATNLSHYIIALDIDSVLINNYSSEDNVDFDRLSNIVVTSNNIAYIIFTSGSTGTPKAVS